MHYILGQILSVLEWKEIISNELFPKLGQRGKILIDSMFLKMRLREPYQKNGAVGRICNTFLSVIIIFEEYSPQSGQHGKKLSIFMYIIMK
jgi:hypothetical protein